MSVLGEIQGKIRKGIVVCLIFYIPNTQTSEVVGYIVAVGQPTEVNAILRLRNVNWKWDVVSKSSVLIEVKNK
jgi:hypothetical protein